MRAALYHGQEDVRIEETESPSVGPEQVHLDVDSAGIRGSDLHEYVAGPIFIPNKEPHPVSGETAPLTLGHEFSGVVTEVGDAVTHLRRGDEVAVNPILCCGECRQCIGGNYHLCDSGGFLGLSGGGGGFAENIVIDAEKAVPLGDGVSLEAGALVEPLSVGLHAVRRSGLRAGDTAAVFGSVRSAYPSFSARERPVHGIFSSLNRGMLDGHEQANPVPIASSIRPRNIPLSPSPLRRKVVSTRRSRSPASSRRSTRHSEVHDRTEASRSSVSGKNR